MRNADVTDNEWSDAERGENAYFSGLGIAVPTVLCGVTPALDIA